MADAPQVIFGLGAVPVASAIVVATYAFLVTERLDRSIIAVLGAGLMIVTGVLTQAEAIRGIDFNTLALLAGMMVLVSIARRSGLLEFLAIWSTQRGQGVPWRILAMLSLVTAVISMLLDNAITVILLVPATLAITRRLQVPPYPFLFAEVMASNIGGTATLIGGPPNMIIGTAAGLSFNDFLGNLGPVVLLVLLLQVLATHLLWGRRLQTTPAARTAVMALEARRAVTDPVLLWQSLAVLAGVVAAFIFSAQLRLQPGTIAMLGAAVLMLLDNIAHRKERQAAKLTQTFGEVDWVTIFFFGGLFVIVHGLAVTGVLEQLSRQLLALTGDDVRITSYVMLWVAGFLSSFIENVPFVATMLPLVKAMAPALDHQKLEPVWWALALGAGLGGNGTLVGAIANVTVAGIAEREGISFSFAAYTKYALPLTALGLALCHLYLWLRYF
jgi:Na+/H+ antiporter NhaD/arsenite permease-like protein